MGGLLQRLPGVRRLLALPLPWRRTALRLSAAVPTRSVSSATSSVAMGPAVRLWAVSDIHTDVDENFVWIRGLSATEYRDDVLILAGDVSDSVERLEVTFKLLLEKFGTLFFVPGNHDLWVTDDEMNSIQKLKSILELCRRLGVVTDARRIGDKGKGCWVSPVLSWHHQSWDTEPDLEGWEIPAVSESMVDYHKCRWPPGTSMFDESAARRVDAMNDSEAVLKPLEGRLDGEPLVTFSHFLPRIELMLEKRFLMYPCLAKASGSAYLFERVKALQPDVHVFGHTHFGWDAIHDGVRYMQAALGYPYEREMRWPSMSNADFGNKNQPLLIWSSDSGFSPKTRCRWSGYYEHHGRSPEKVWELASYAARGFRQTDKRAAECMPDFSFW
eukprot:TRINITY_DN43842_c0_g1_i1.p1 TRINITY_DN43842_c0_g1~~TRINITY_DN43842_c0_g1_i1.p1  ORF type:complete len:386 (+),score=69.12 TRINITY_DN43842_c0_g1_i1:36-1193(+)